MLGGLPAQPPLTSAPTPGPPPSFRSAPIPTYPSLASAPPARPFSARWAWGPGLGPSLSSSVAQTVDDFLLEKWHKYFPGKFPAASVWSGLAFPCPHSCPPFCLPLLLTPAWVHGEKTWLGLLQAAGGMSSGDGGLGDSAGRLSPPQPPSMQHPGGQRPGSLR